MPGVDGRLLVVCKDDQTLEVIDLPTGTTAGRITASGFTPHEVAATPDGRRAYLPIYGEPNSARAALFHRLDVRIEKRFVLGGPGSSDSVTFYLDVQNAYNERRPEATAYSFDYRQRTQVKGLPILPILGVRGQL